MAVSSTKTNDGIWIGGNGKRYELGTLTFDGTILTIAVPTSLTHIDHAVITPLGPAAGAEIASLDATLTAGGGVKPTGGLVLASQAATGDARDYFYMFVGF